MNVIKLTQKLISIPSYFDEKTNEKKIGEFVYNYLRKFSFLEVEKQIVENNRFNIIARTKGKPRLFFAGHLDTVQPKKGWSTNQFSGKIINKKLFGLGSLDTKSGVAALLDSLNDFKDISGLTMLFYCDEEYDFKGIKKFIKSNKKKIGDFGIFIEPTKLKICNIHRGLIEIKLIVKGETGHAKNSKNGKNAILATIKSINNFEKWLEGFDNEKNGENSINVACIRGGLYLGKDKKNKIILGSQGNNIADFSEFIIDIRQNSKKINAEKIIEYFKKEIKKNKCILSEFLIRHNYNCLNTDKEKTKKIQKIINESIKEIKFLGPTEMGYGEAPIIQDKYSIPVIYFGPKGGNAHGINEWVDIESIQQCREIYKKIISSLF